MNFICALSNEIASEPIVSPVSGSVFERRLILKYLEENDGRDPINGLKLDKNQLVKLNSKVLDEFANSPLVISNRKENDFSLSELVRFLREQWDNMVLQIFNLKKQLSASEREKDALYQQIDESCKIINMLKNELIKHKQRKSSHTNEHHARASLQKTCNGGSDQNIYSNLPTPPPLHSSGHKVSSLHSSSNKENQLDRLYQLTSAQQLACENQFRKHDSINRSSTSRSISTVHSSNNSKFSDHLSSNSNLFNETSLVTPSINGSYNCSDRLTVDSFHNEHRQVKTSKFAHMTLDMRREAALSSCCNTPNTTSTCSKPFSDLSGSSNNLNRSSPFQKYHKQLSFSTEYVNLENSSKLLGVTNGRNHRPQSVTMRNNDNLLECELNGLMKSCEENLNLRNGYLERLSNNGCLQTKSNKITNGYKKGATILEPINQKIMSSTGDSLRDNYNGNKGIANEELYCNLMAANSEFDQISQTSSSRFAKSSTVANYENILLFDDDFDPRNSQKLINQNTTKTTSTLTTSISDLSVQENKISSDRIAMKQKENQDHGKLNTKSCRAESWSKNFKNLLTDPIGIRTFTNFLIMEYSDENIKFWERCERYKCLNSKDERKKEAKRIFDEFIKLKDSKFSKSDKYKESLLDSTKKSINIDADVRNQLKENLKNNNITEDLFERSQTQIYNLMKDDSYRRFLNSEGYKKMLLEDSQNHCLPIEPMINEPKLPTIKRTRRKSLLGTFGRKSQPK